MEGFSTLFVLISTFENMNTNSCNNESITIHSISIYWASIMWGIQRLKKKKDEINNVFAI